MTKCPAQKGTRLKITAGELYSGSPKTGMPSALLTLSDRTLACVHVGRSR